jgi:hypothetical protein
MAMQKFKFKMNDFTHFGNIDLFSVSPTAARSLLRR